jgi:hypothetical protein
MCRVRLCLVPCACPCSTCTSRACTVCCTTHIFCRLLTPSSGLSPVAAAVCSSCHTCQPHICGHCPKCPKEHKPKVHKPKQCKDECRHKHTHKPVSGQHHRLPSIAAILCCIVRGNASALCRRQAGFRALSCTILCCTAALVNGNSNTCSMVGIGSTWCLLCRTRMHTHHLCECKRESPLSAQRGPWLEMPPGQLVQHTTDAAAAKVACIDSQLYMSSHPCCCH